MTDAKTLILQQHGQSTPTPRSTRSPERPPRTSGPRVTIALTGLTIVVGIVLWATMSPTPLDQGYEGAIDRLLGVLHRNGVPEWFGYNKLEFSANVLMFVPFGFLLSLALPRRAVWATLLVIPVFSASIELIQAIALSARFATPLDVLANTIGGYLGAIVAFLIRAAVYARDEKVIARADWERATGRR